MLQKLVNTLTLFILVLILVGILWILTVFSMNLAVL
jgi:heme/copper-type cytochrome/quinol oxidase subunit 4